MKQSFFSFPTDTELLMTGERYIPGIQGAIQLEHFHRYLFALQFACGRDVIDVASGEGYGSALLAQVANSVIGVDVDTGAIENSIRRYGSKKLLFRVGDATQLPCESNSIDLATSFETIEHLEGHEVFLSELKRVLLPHGVLVISTPDRPYYQATLTSPNVFHRKELDRQEFQLLLSRHFQNVKILEQRSLYGSVMTSTDDSHSATPLEFFYSENGSDFKRVLNKMNSPFLIAVASDEELPDCATSIMNSPAEIEKLRADLGYAAGEMWKLQARVPQIESQCLELTSRVEQLAGDLRKAQVVADLAKAETRYLREKMKRQLLEQSR